MQFEAKQSVKHDGVLYRAGQILEGAAEAFAELVRDGIIAVLDAEKAQAQTAQEEAKPEAREDAAKAEAPAPERPEQAEAAPVRPYETAKPATEDSGDNL